MASMVGLNLAVSSAFVLVQTSAFGLFIESFGSHALPYAYFSVAILSSLIAYLYLQVSQRVSFSTGLVHQSRIPGRHVPGLLAWTAFATGALVHLPAPVLVPNADESGQPGRVAPLRARVPRAPGETRLWIDRGRQLDRQHCGRRAGCIFPRRLVSFGAVSPGGHRAWHQHARSPRGAPPLPIRRRRRPCVPGSRLGRRGRQGGLVASVHSSDLRLHAAVVAGLLHSGEHLLPPGGRSVRIRAPLWRASWDGNWLSWA